MRQAAILPGATLGVLGGGQLGRMFAIAAAQLGYRVICLTPEGDAAAADVCHKTITASFDDAEKLTEFAKQVAAVTIEFENIPAAALELVSRYAPVRPGAHILHTTQNRLREKTFLAKNGLPVVPFDVIESLADLDSSMKKRSYNAVLKTAGFGYDGKGQTKLNAGAKSDALEAAFSSLKGQQAVLEKFVDYQREFSVIGVRGVNGEFAAFGPIENDHKNHILDLSFAPAKMSASLGKQSIEIVRSLMETMEAVGLLCVEFFHTTDDTILINELAPRPHNSGHLTIEGCRTSQFEQQVRATAGLPLGCTELRGAAAMAQLLGDLWQHGEPHWDAALSLPDVHLHLYGKTEARVGRKMGHLTAGAQTADEATRKATKARGMLTKVRA